ncbi:uncharacterized protein LOC129906808 [Episyrphus balteatus]|uniref:uncharacterized protein LOC129906808 n=1 Tax=Episyrphus balteatus TaxID=286459 RepID=UPI0024864016|nr:uncharacterized protein LOC129906808 [Episyrphus balteatus]
MSNLIKVIFFLVISSIFNQVYCLRCYTCSYVDPSPDKSCISSSETEGQRTTLCSKKYCTIQRQETLNPPGKIVSFIRDCQDKPLYLNDIQSDSTYKVYYRSCTSDLCNNGDGRQILSAADPDFGAGENLIVEGKNGSFSKQTISLYLILLTWVMCIIF